jgi:putative ABC transport system permease protein
VRLTAVSSAPWTRAPVLRRSPAVLLAIVLSAAVLSVATASGVLFLASVSTGSLHSTAARECPEDAEPAITNANTASQFASSQQTPAGVRNADPVVAAAVRAHGLPAPDRVAMGSVAFPAVHNLNFASATLFARPGALAHVDVVASAGGSGVWIPRTFATATGTRPGTTLRTDGTALRVAGVYRDLASSAFIPLFELPRYWCTWRDQLVPTPLNRPAPFFLTDLATVEAASSEVDVTWYVPGDISAMTVPQAQDRLDAANAALAAIRLPHYRMVTGLGNDIATAQRVRSGLSGSVLPIDIGGVVVALLLVAAGGQYWALRRGAEIHLLSSRGVHPAALGLKAVLETGPSVLIGATAGWLAAVGLVRSLGPSALLDPGAPLTALGLAAAAAVVGLLLIGAIGTAAGRSAMDHAVRPRRLAAFPWEVALLLAAAGAYGLVRRDGAVHVVKATVQVNPMVFAFPLLALAGIVALTARGSRPVLRRLADHSDVLPNAGYLAFKRMAGTPAVAVGIIVGVALPCSVLLYSSALTGSASADVRAKNDTNVGAEVVFGTLASPSTTPDLHGHGTIVSFFQNDVANTTTDGTRIQMLGVDPTSFTRFAHGGSALDPLIDELSVHQGRPSALLVNAPSQLEVHAVRLRDTTMPVAVVDRVASFPGLRDGYEPMLVIDRRALTHVDRMAERVELLWTTNDDATAALAALRADGVGANYQITTNTFLDNSGLRPITWIFGYLRALAYLVGVVALTGLTLALAARARQHALDYHLARRMGLTRMQNTRSLTIELGTLIGFGCALGIATATGAVALVYRMLDLYRSLPPPPTYPVPATAAAYALGTAVLMTGVGAIAMQRWYDRTNPSELLRE